MCKKPSNLCKKEQKFQILHTQKKKTFEKQLAKTKKNVHMLIISTSGTTGVTLFPSLHLQLP